MHISIKKIYIQYSTVTYRTMKPVQLQNCRQKIDDTTTVQLHLEIDDRLNLRNSRITFQHSTQGTIGSSL
jgi:hypothetical protein